MFVVTHADIDKILKDFEIFSTIKGFSELQRYYYERENPDSKEVRLIIKVELNKGLPLVIRFKNESDVTIKIIESQCRFADELRKNGIETPCQYRTNGAFAKWYSINGYDIIVTVEQFMENEVKVVDAVIAEKTGELLAKMHNISEKNNLHVQNKVLFDPFDENDLFDFVSFKSLETTFCGDEKELFDRIVQKYNFYLEMLLPLKRESRYAVQGDVSDCNLYQTCLGDIGVFDFNRCGDNNLFCDAVMQAIFVARLMDYPPNAEESIEMDVLASFLRGYCLERGFSEEQQKLYPYLYAMIDAFWSADIKWNEDSLINAVNSGDMEKARKWLVTIWKRLSSVDEKIQFEILACKHQCLRGVCHGKKSVYCAECDGCRGCGLGS